jgi:phosphoserine phosphatase
MVTVHHQQGRLAGPSRVVLESRHWENPRNQASQIVSRFRCGQREFVMIRNASPDLIDMAREAMIRGETAAVITETVCPPKAMFFDMDATVIAEESLVEIARVCGKQEEIEALTTRAMAGGMDFKESLRLRLSILKGLTRDQVLSIQPTICRGMTDISFWAKEQQIPLFLISGGFVDLAEPIARQLEFRDFKANRFAWDQDIMAGDCDGPILDGHGKRDAVLAWCQHLGIAPTACVTIGDGANDRLMMEVSGLAVGFCPKKTLWPILDVANHTGDHRFLIHCLSHR